VENVNGIPGVGSFMNELWT